ncbi:hypothetical protein BT63DRAFT_449902 [Microthyrium microscopicum]|uniref:Uncharacterized protein n=1 Tax=Microthyrium microscopicum TaxID=703497 RepID=A0A6A6UU09_9PEZI|nr:hypothetical protein BT63DRAFT_449902 [Microthyrium microscopicum]
MRVAELLSDLISLRACDPSAAQNLVSVRPAPASTGDSKSTKESPEESDEDPDLKRAKDLIKLHDAMKVRNANGQLDSGLSEARRSVRELHIG